MPEQIWCCWKLSLEIWYEGKGVGKGGIFSFWKSLKSFLIFSSVRRWEKLPEKIKFHGRWKLQWKYDIFGENFVFETKHFLLLLFFCSYIISLILFWDDSLAGFSSDNVRPTICLDPIHRSTIALFQQCGYQRRKNFNNVDIKDEYFYQMQSTQNFECCPVLLLIVKSSLKDCHELSKM